MIEPVPVPLDQVERELAQTEAALRPIPPEELMVELAMLLELFPVPPNWNRISGFYLEAFEDVPRDLAKKALKHCRMTCRFFPRLAELREPILDELHRRQYAQGRLETAKRFGRFPERLAIKAVSR